MILFELCVLALLEFDELKKKYAQECEQVSGVFSVCDLSTVGKMIACVSYVCLGSLPLEIVITICTET